MLIALKQALDTLFLMRIFFHLINTTNKNKYTSRKFNYKHGKAITRVSTGSLQISEENPNLVTKNRERSYLGARHGLLLGQIEFGFLQGDGAERAVLAPLHRDRLGSDGRVEATLQVSGGVGFNVGGNFEARDIPDVGGRRGSNEDRAARVVERGKHGNGVRWGFSPDMVNLELRECRKHVCSERDRRMT